MGVRNATAVWLTAATVVVLASGMAFGYDGLGHHLAARAAVAALPGEMPGFFRAGAAGIANASMDPDIFRLNELPQIKNAEDPEHYFDMELLKGQTLPALRYQLLDLCVQEKIQPRKLGMLPYALAEWTQRLTVAFAEHRRWPDNPHIQAKCIVYAGILAHYAADSSVPLHTTIDFDGRALEGGKSPRSGIHAKVDALIQKLPVERAEVASRVKPEAYGKLWPAILRQLDRSHSLVDKTYELEPLLPGREEPLPADPKVTAFARDRLAAAAAFTASLYLTAWRDSASLKFPEWHIREREATEAGKVAGSQRAGTSQAVGR